MGFFGKSKKDKSKKDKKEKSSKNEKSGKSEVNYLKIGNNYETWDGLISALRKVGLESSNLLLAIDFTKSNNWQGKNTYGDKSLHTIENPPAYSPSSNNFYQVPNLNPYEYVISCLSTTLNAFDDDGYIPTVIFGHARSKGESYMKAISQDSRGSVRLEGVLYDYREALKHNGFSGPTTFAPIVDWAANIAKETQEYHILIIIGDGCVSENEVDNTIKSIQQASKYPLSIIFVGVGDGDSPDQDNKWELMQEFDDNIPGRDVDNWQSVYLSEINASGASRPDIELATECMMEIPIQYDYFKKHGMIQI